jgi:glycine hydroxymethyltransferase
VTDIPQEIERVNNLVSEHDKWRSHTLNLIASENTVSPAVRKALNNDWLGRYADFTGRDLDDRRYRGTRYMVEIEHIVEELAKEVFQADFFELRPISGHLAGIAVLMALCKPGDTVLETNRSSGGHREASKFVQPALIDLDVQFLPFDGEHYNIDLPAAAQMIEETRPRIVILGTSNFLFPHPVRQIKEALSAANPDGVLVYDASHVLGLLAGGCFQAPLAEGADVVFSSTHKTFPGPQGGIIFSNRGDLIETISEAVYPALVTNHHPFRMPALATALAEMREFGSQYASQITMNSQALGAALEKEGIPCVKVGEEYSRSHTVLMRIAEFGRGSDIAAKLEGANIICTSLGLPESLGSHGIRLGVQELSHHGATPSDMQQVARLIADVLLDRRATAEIAKDVYLLVGSLGPVKFTR